MNKLKIKIDDLPGDFIKGVAQILGNYTVGVIFDGTPIGSGTLVEWDDQFGILTAEHVTNNPESSRLRLDFSGNDSRPLQLMVANYPTCLEFDGRWLKNVTLGIRESDEFGPDLSVIVLPRVPQLDTLKAKKSFLNIGHDPDKKMASALIDEGTIFVCGFPGEGQQSKGPQSGFSETVLLPGLAGASYRSMYFERNGLDYLEINSKRDESNDPITIAPKSYGGVSGGSFWRVPIYWESKSDNIIFKEVYFAGVPYLELPVDEFRSTIRAHGPKSVFQVLLSTLRKSK
jgi:hypothetical protein